MLVRCGGNCWSDEFSVTKHSLRSNRWARMQVNFSLERYSLNSINGMFNGQFFPLLLQVKAISTFKYFQSFGKLSD